MFRVFDSSPDRFMIILHCCEAKISSHSHSNTLSETHRSEFRTPNIFHRFPHVIVFRMRNADAVLRRGMKVYTARLLEMTTVFHGGLPAAARYLLSSEPFEMIQREEFSLQLFQFEAPSAFYLLQKIVEFIRFISLFVRSPRLFTFLNALAKVYCGFICEFFSLGFLFVTLSCAASLISTILKSQWTSSAGGNARDSYHSVTERLWAPPKEGAIEADWASERRKKGERINLIALGGFPNQIEIR